MIMLRFGWLCVLLLGVGCITKFDFNVCRINNCNTEEINCINDQTECLNYYAQSRNW